MPKKKLMLETARKKWATQSANLALLLGERIKLIYRFSQEAEQLRTQPDGPTENDLRLAFSGIFTNPQNNKTINPKAVHSYMRFHRLSPAVVDLIAEHASGNGGHSVGLSYGLKLAEVGNHESQMELLRSAIDGKWSVLKLWEMAEPHRDIATVPKQSRPTVTFGKIETAAVGLRNQMTELTMADTLLETIGESPHRSDEESAALVEKIVNTKSLLDEICQMQQEVSDMLDLAAEKVLEAAKD